MSDRQEEILAFIGDYQREHTVPPSTRVIQRQFRFASQTSVMRHLRGLAARGAVEQLTDGSWGVRAREVQGRLFDVTVYGSIPAGVPAEASPEVGGRTIPVDPALFGLSAARGRELWALEVSGESMVGAHIVPGDLALFERREPQPGEIVAALVDGAITLKRLVRRGGGLVLRAENPRYAEIRPAEQLEVQGVLVGLIRRGGS
jgi:repressor LexA